MYALDIWIRVLHVRSANLFMDWRPVGATVMFYPFERIQRSAFPLINFLSKSKCNRLGKRPVSDLKCFSAEVMDVDDRDDIPYS